MFLTKYFSFTKILLTTIIMAQKNYEKLLTELMRKIPQNKLVKHLFLNYTNGKGGNEYQVINKICRGIFDKPANLVVSEDEEENADINKKENSTFNPVYDKYSEFINDEKDTDIDWEAVFNPELINEDYRIAKITFENFRKFPGKGNNEFPYGVSFKQKLEDKTPCSAIILGVNGVGKSSVYQGIEYIYRKEIGEARLRDYGKREDTESDRFKRYISNWTCNDSCVKMEVNGVNKVFTNEIPLQAEQGALSNCLKYGFFISEYDIIRLGQMKIEHGGHDSLRMQIANALDMGELNWLNRLVYKLAIYQSNLKVEDINIDEEITSKQNIIEENNEFFSHVDFLMNLHPKSLPLEEFLKCLPATLEIPDIHIITSYAEKAVQHASNILEIKPIVNKKYASDKSLLGISSERKVNTQLKLIIEEFTKILQLKNMLTDEIEFINNSRQLQNIKIKDEYINKMLEQFKDDLIKIIIETHEDPSPMKIGGLNTLKKQCEEVISFISMQLIPNLLNWEKERKELVKALRLTKVIECYKNFSQTGISERIKKNNQLAEEIIELKLAKKECEDRICQNNVIQCIKRDAFQIYKLINEKIASQLQDEVTKIDKSIIQVIMSKFLNKDEELIWTWDRMLIKEEDGNFIAVTDSRQNKYLACMIRDKISGCTISVKKHFNTFRYHLFNTILNMAFSFAVMKRLNVKLPIVLDDIFYASDFHNRKNIKHFVESILSAYNSIFEKMKDEDESKLQLVIFTHDELVFKSITEGIKESYKKDYQKHFIFYSLLHHNAADPDRIFEINNLTFNLNSKNNE